jgi:hypothetical protein
LLGEREIKIAFSYWSGKKNKNGKNILKINEFILKLSSK